MAFTLPNPNVPLNGQLGDATPILENELAIAQAIAAFDGSQITTGTVKEPALDVTVDPRLRGSETASNFVYSGCQWSLVTGLNGTMTGGTIYVNGYRVPVSGVGSNTFAASSDTYVYVDYLGNVTYLPAANNGTSPSAVANAILVAIVATNGSLITFINQGQTDTTLANFAPVVTNGTYYTVCDSIGNLIYPTDPVKKLLGYREFAFNYNAGTSNQTNIPFLLLPVIVPLGRKVRLSAYGILYESATQRGMYMQINESATQLVVAPTTAFGANVQSTVNPSCYIYPSSGLHNYQASISCDTGGNVSIFASVSARAYISAELE